MKTMMMAIAMVLGFTATAQAGSFAEVTLPAGVESEQGIQDVYAQEAQKPGTALNKYLAGIKQADPDYYIDDAIGAEDIFRLECGRSGGTFYCSYLVMVRAGYKSNSFPMGYLKVSTSSDSDGEGPTKLVIEGPAKVTIE
ncbi:hypothetical protein [Bdellovibrio sp. HCB209]|uniref:hypothetical protein n=1 Tax=Bdellovibrio sp. HCB209 TaxID=3394354 RepID=UPI0039B6913F